MNVHRRRNRVHHVLEISRGTRVRANMGQSHGHALSEAHAVLLLFLLTANSSQDFRDKLLIVFSIFYCLKMHSIRCPHVQHLAHPHDLSSIGLSNQVLKYISLIPIFRFDAISVC